jgi:hypothetical protein
VIIPSARRDLPLALAALASIVGLVVAIRYHELGLTLTHYDARGHLVVARRIFDSLTPGWQQVGAVWLPLPHLLNALPVQVDAWYRSGASAVAISILSYAVAVGGLAWIILQTTGSAIGAIAGAALFALNPNVLYLQATPMTEPLLLALTICAVAALLHWTVEPRRDDEPASRSILIGGLFALACLTRYEAWPVTAAALVAAAWSLRRRDQLTTHSFRSLVAMAAVPAAAVVLFGIYSRVVIGAWFVSGGFFVPENKALGDPRAAVAEILYGLRTLSGTTMFALGVIGVTALAVTALVRRERSPSLVALSLGAAAALPWIAFVEGHPFRIRYMVPLVAIESIGAGTLTGWIARRSRVVAGVVMLLVVLQAAPFDEAAPMIVEAQWDRPNLPVRDRVTACLGRAGTGEKIMASMGSLGHYMQETSAAGFALSDFLHEGNGDIWLSALQWGPRPFAEWVLVEEKAEGGDMLARIARENPRFLEGYARVCEGAGLALYRRTDGHRLGARD